jgi:hypothetical protein
VWAGAAAAALVLLVVGLGITSTSGTGDDESASTETEPVERAGGDGSAPDAAGEFPAQASDAAGPTSLAATTTAVPPPAGTPEDGTAESRTSSASAGGVGLVELGAFPSVSALVAAVDGLPSSPAGPGPCPEPFRAAGATPEAAATVGGRSVLAGRGPGGVLVVEVDTCRPLT